MQEKVDKLEEQDDILRNHVFYNYYLPASDGADPTSRIKK